MAFSPSNKSNLSLHNLYSLTPQAKNNEYFRPSKNLFHEVCLILQLSLPIGIAIVSEWIPVYAGNAVLGHLPNAELVLSGAGLARTFNNVTGASLAWAFTQGLFTLIPQAIGQNRIDLLGLYLQRATVICFLIALPLSVLQLFGADFFVAIGEPKEIHTVIYDCCKWGIGNIFALNLVSLIQKIAQAFNYQYQLLIISLFCALVAYPLAIALIKPQYLDLGYIGCPIAVFVLNFFNSLCIILFLIFKGHYQLFIPHTISEIFNCKQIYRYIMLCIPALFTNSLEWWIIEITTALAGYVSNPDIALSANIIIGNIQVFTALLALGNSAGCSIRVGKYIGCNMSYKAKQAHNAGLIVSGIYSLVMVIVIYLCIDKLPLIFTNKDESQIVNTATDGLYMIVFGVSFQNISQCLAGVYRAMGKQTYSAVFISGAYYFIGLTLTLILLFAFDFRNNLIDGVLSIWLGWTVANVCSSALLEWFYQCCVDWYIIIQTANQRIDKETKIMKAPQSYGSINRGLTV